MVQQENRNGIKVLTPHWHCASFVEEMCETFEQLIKNFPKKKKL